MVPITKYEKGVYVCYLRSKEGHPIKQVSPDVFLKLENPVIRNIKGEYVKFPSDPGEFKPRCFADYYLYVFEHAFDTDIDNAIMTISYELLNSVSCTVCDAPTWNYYLEPDFHDKNDDVILYAICDNCFEKTHIAKAIKEDEEL